MDYLKHLTDIIELKLGVNLLENHTRQRDVVDARRLYCDLAKTLSKYTFNDIGKHINKNHATVIHLCKTSNDLKATDKEYLRKHELIYENIERLPLRITLEEAHSYHLQKVRYYKGELNRLQKKTNDIEVVYEKISA
jgi:hypothetical protein